MSKKLILEYLQKNTLDLMEKYKEITEIHYMPKPARILIIAKKDFEPPRISYQGKDFKVEVAVNEHYEEPEVTGESPELTEWKLRHKVKPQGVVDNVVDVSASPDKAHDRKAYEAWRQRHSGIKTKEE